MKLIHIIGILFLILSVGCASATQITLVANTGITFEKVTVTYNDPSNPNKIIFEATRDNTLSPFPPNPWFFYVGLVDGTGITINPGDITDNSGHVWSDGGQQNILGVNYHIYEINENNQHTASIVTIPYTGTISGTPQFGAHVAWGVAYPAGSNAESSAKFYSGSTTPPNTNVPEFPTVVLPVAAILGILIIFGRRNK